MDYLIGIDGGGTKTACIVTDPEGKILFECTGGPSNFLVFGVETVAQTILSLVDQCVNNLNISPEKISAVILGTAGAGRRPDAEKLENEFFRIAASRPGGLKNFRVESDARIALEGAFSGKPGSILIAGTGSIMFGKDRNENIHRVGGFGRFFGDEGSGFILGKKGLSAVSKEFDGRGGKTLITGLLKEKFNIYSSEILITEVYKNNFDIASAAPLVIESAEKGDAAALKIIYDETDELVNHVSTMYKKINEDTLDLAFIGGLITHDNIYSQTFVKKIKQLIKVNIKEPDYPPAMGAVLMARKLI